MLAIVLTCYAITYPIFYHTYIFCYMQIKPGYMALTKIVVDMQHYFVSIKKTLISILRAILPVLWLTTHKLGFYHFSRIWSSSSPDKSALLDGIDFKQK